jgi:hypothetical protein
MMSINGHDIEIKANLYAALKRIRASPNNDRDLIEDNYAWLQKLCPYSEQWATCHGLTTLGHPRHLWIDTLGLYFNYTGEIQ